MILNAVIVLAVLGALFGAILAFASNKFAVEVDPRVNEIIDVLPGANCGACGYPGCSGYANAVVSEGAPCNCCVVGKDKVAGEVAKIMGQEPEKALVRKVAQIHCNGTFENAIEKYEYQGIHDCHLAVTQFGGPSYCKFGCIGLGSCEKACPFNAIHIKDRRIPEVNTAACMGCGICANQCPQKLISIVPIDKRIHVRCNNRDKGKEAREECAASCISCGLCTKVCPTGAISLFENIGGTISMIDYDKCIGCGTCVAKCPRHCIHLDPPIDPDIVPCVKPTAVELGCDHCPISDHCSNK